MQAMWTVEESTGQKGNGGLRMNSRRNYQEVTLKEILKNVKVRCSVCHSKMIRVIDLYDDTLIGYSCENCPHYNLLDNDPV